MQRLLLILFSLLITGCASQLGSRVPIPREAPAGHTLQSSSTVIPGSVANIFAAAQNLTLTPAQIDNYIDPSVVGDDRALALKLMTWMPPNMRGDFVYSSHTGHFVSNNPAMLAQIVVSYSPYGSKAEPIKAQSPMVQSTRHRDDYSSSCSPPNPPSNPYGAYVRQVGLCGFTAGAGFINVPCGDTNLVQGDTGFLYFELQGSRGSLVEGGFQYNSDSSIQPYVRASYESGYETLNNSGQHFTCGENIGVLHGETQNAQYTYTTAGQLPSNLQPQTNFYNGQQFTFQNQEWLFGPGGSDFAQEGADPLGNYTPCTGCSISRVTSLAQSYYPNYLLDGSYFGVDTSGYNAINWMQVAFGQWQNNCEPGTSLCTFVYSSQPSRYYGGAQYYPNSDYSSSDINTNVSYGPYESYDGIDLENDAEADSVRKPKGAFNEPLPPAATPSPSPAPTRTPPCGDATRRVETCPQFKADGRTPNLVCC